MTFSADPTKPKSQSKAAVKKRRQRAARKARQAAANENADTVLTDGAKPVKPKAPKPEVALPSAPDLPVHTTEPVTASDSPDRFTHVPEPLSAQPSPSDSEPVGTPAADPSAAAPESTDNSDSRAAGSGGPTKPETTLAEAQLFGKLVVGYFQLGTASLFKKDPRTQQAFLGLVMSLPEFQGEQGPVKLTPDQAYAALCGFIGGASERTAIKYNLRIPFVDELTVAGAIGIATYGLIPKRKPKNANATAGAAAAKDANPTGTNGVSTNEEAKQAAEDAQPGHAPINTAHADDLDSMA